MAKCEKENCPNQATHSVTLNVPAMGVPIDLHSPIKMYIGVELCEGHAKEFGNDFNWNDNEDLKEAIQSTLQATGRSEADFSRSFHSTVSIKDQGYLQFLKVKAERPSS